MTGNYQKSMLFACPNRQTGNEDKSLFEKLGYNVIPAATAGRAIEILTLMPGIDLVVVTIRPETETEDLESAEKIRNACSLPVLLLVSQDQTAALQKIPESGCEGFLVRESGHDIVGAALRMMLKAHHDRKAAGEELKHKRQVDQLVKDAMEQSHYAVAILDSNRFYLFANKAYRENFCQSLEPITGKHHDEVFPNLHSKWGEMHSRVLAGESLSSDRDAYVREDGTLDWLRWEARPWRDQHGGVGGLILYSEIITDRIQKEEQRIVDDYDITELINRIYDPVWIIDYAGKVLKVNDAVIEQLGYSRNELIPDGLPLVDPAIGKASVNNLGGTIPDRILDTCHIAKDGTRIPVELSASFITWQGKPAVMSIIRDVTHRKKVEEGLQKLLSDKDLQFREINHRVKNNLGILHSLLSLESFEATTENGKQVLEDAAARILSMKALYETLNQSDRHQRINIQQYLGGLVDQMNSFFNYSENVVANTGTDTFDLSTQSAALLGIILNELITNSMKYAFEGVEKPEIRISTRKEGDTVTFICGDNGKGLPESVSIENSESFGLRLVHMLVSQLKGKVSVERESGTTFTIEFEDILLADS
ncbi:PAS domain S-box protein [Balneolales bacterium ANBcel1]|nr:PAS domain S-box protein [Balneolales bacterium ANBcel1]